MALNVVLQLGTKISKISEFVAHLFRNTLISWCSTSSIVAKAYYMAKFQECPLSNVEDSALRD